MGKVYGYIRISTKEQNEERQKIALKQVVVEKDNIFLERQSGKNFNRPVYQQMLKILKPDDLLYITSIDRLGRNYEEIQIQWRRLTKEIGADICVIDMPLLDTRTGKDLMGAFIADLVLQILSFVAQKERENIRCRQKEGIAAAKARGVQFGRPPAPLPKNFDELYRAWRRNQISLRQAALECRMPTATFYSRALKIQGEEADLSL